MNFENLYLTTSELADLLHIKRNTIERWRVSKSCPVPWTKIGGRILYKKQDILDYLETQQRLSTNQNYGVSK